MRPQSVEALIMQPWHLFVLAVASIINREQQQVIEYLEVENRVLKQQLKR